MIYADFNGSSLLCNAVKEYLSTRISDGPYANPNSIHSLGRKINLGIEKCRRLMAEILNAEPNQLIFNSGSSEGISHVFFSLLDNTSKKTIIISSIEHSAVINAAKYYEQKGFTLKVVPVNNKGQVDLGVFRETLSNSKDDLALVSIMAANNETGVIQPYKEIGKICQEFNVPFFSDTTQFIAKADFDFANSNIDYAVLSSHKIGALIGSGALIAKDPETLTPMVFGGGQERGLRGGTQNYIGIECMAVALKSFADNISCLEKCLEKRENFEREIKEKFPQVEIIGADAPRLASTCMLGMKGMHGQAIQIELESHDIFVTTSSACSDNEPETSKVLKAMGIDDALGRSVIRISLCMGQKSENYNYILNKLTETFEKLGKIKSF